jgi:tyrosyl-tRNA synthetase
MSQSVGNYIAITEAPDDMFGKLMRLPDHLMEKYLRLTTDLEDAEIARTLALPPQEAKRRLGEEVVKLYHGADAAATARARFDKVFVDHETPDDVPVVQIPADAVDGDGNVYLPRLLASLGLASSSSEGRRLIRDGGVHIDDATCTAEEVAADELRGTLLRVGKRRFVRLS